MILSNEDSNGFKEDFMIFCNINDIEIYLKDINKNSDSKDQAVNDYPIHTILKIEELAKKLEI